jgi:hypothetical protein
MASEFSAESLESMDRYLQKWEGGHKLGQRVRGGLQQIRKKACIRSSRNSTSAA